MRGKDGRGGGGGGTLETCLRCSRIARSKAETASTLLIASPCQTIFKRNLLMPCAAAYICFCFFRLDSSPPLYFDVSIPAAAGAKGISCFGESSVLSAHSSLVHFFRFERGPTHKCISELETCTSTALSTCVLSDWAVLTKRRNT